MVQGTKREETRASDGSDRSRRGGSAASSSVDTRLVVHVARACLGLVARKQFDAGSRQYAGAPLSYCAHSATGVFVFLTELPAIAIVPSFAPILCNQQQSSDLPQTLPADLNPASATGNARNASR